MTLSDLLTEANERGWLLNNLYQTNTNWWQCNLRNATQATGFGRGLEPEVALANAMDSMELVDLIPNEPFTNLPNKPAPLDILSLVLSDNPKPAQTDMFKRRRI